MQLNRVEFLSVVIISSLFWVGKILASERVKRGGPDLSVIALEAAAQVKEAIDNGAAFKKNYSIKAGIQMYRLLKWIWSEIPIFFL